LNGFINNVTVTIQLSHSFFTSQRLLLSSKKNAGRKEGGKKDKSYTKDVIEENISINEKNRDFDINRVETKINVVIEKLKKEYSSMRIGRANPGLKFLLEDSFK